MCEYEYTEIGRYTLIACEESVVNIEMRMFCAFCILRMLNAHDNTGS